jgi:hypothetical protein
MFHQTHTAWWFQTNLDYFPLHIWDVILPIDSYFLRGVGLYHQPVDNCFVHPSRPAHRVGVVKTCPVVCVFFSEVRWQDENNKSNSPDRYVQRIFCLHHHSYLHYVWSCDNDEPYLSTILILTVIQTHTPSRKDFPGVRAIVSSLDEKCYIYIYSLSLLGGQTCPFKSDWNANVQ